MCLRWKLTFLILEGMQTGDLAAAFSQRYYNEKETLYLILQKKRHFILRG